MKITTLALLTGMITGVFFSYFKLPLPAPPTLPGLAGIIGVFLGAVMFQYLSHLFK